MKDYLALSRKAVEDRRTRLGDALADDPEFSAWSDAAREEYARRLAQASAEGHDPAEAERMARRAAMVVNLDLPASFGEGPIGDLLDVFGGDGVRLVSLTKAGQRLLPADQQAHDPVPQVRRKPRRVQIRTLEATTWHDAGRGMFTIPAGTLGHVVDIDAAGISEDERTALRATKARARRRRIVGQFVWLEGRIRFMVHQLFEFVKT